MAYKEIIVDIQQSICTLAKNPSGWSKEVNLVAWNGGPAKIDIREWTADHERMTRGVTLYEEEARVLMESLIQYFEKEDAK